MGSYCAFCIHTGNEEGRSICAEPRKFTFFAASRPSGPVPAPSTLFQKHFLLFSSNSSKWLLPMLLIWRCECNKRESDGQRLPHDGCWLPGRTSALFLQCANKPHHHPTPHGLSDLYHVSMSAVHDEEVTYD